MARFALLAALLACLSVSASAQCVPYPDASSQYTIQLCPLLANELTAPALSNPTTITFPSADSAVSSRIILDFPIMFYGQSWDYIAVSTNGALFFGPSPATISTSRIPVSGSYVDAVPLLAPIWADFWMANTSSVSYATQGTAGSRQFIVRFNHMLWWTSRLTSPTTHASFDVIFYEAPAGKIDVMYYNYSPRPGTSSVLTTVGMQASDSVTSWTMFNGFNNWTVLADTLHAQKLQFTYVGQPVNQIACGALGYDLNSIRNTQLNFGPDATGSMWYYAPCGEVSNAVCDSDVTANKAMICVVNGTDAIDVGTFGPKAFTYQFTPESPSGLQALIQTGEKCTGGGSFAGDRFTTVNYICDATATSPRISAVYTPAVCVYQLDVMTNLVCGPGTRGNGPAEFPASTLSQCVRTMGSFYNANLCPRRGHNAPMPLQNPTQVMINTISSGSSGVIPLGFEFTMYGEVYTSVNMALNGGLYFGQVFTGIPTAAPRFGATSTDSYPSIVAFGAGLSAAGYNGVVQPNITYSYERINNVAAFVARYTNVRYSAFRAMYMMSMTFDIIIMETGAIEIRYYQIAPNGNTQIQIGVHGVDFDTYTSVLNYEYMTSDLAFQFQGATLSFEYTGRNRYSVCGAFGANFTDSITTDLVFQSEGFTYYINPCGTVTATDACRAISPSSSVCQVSSTGLGNSLTTFNPTATAWYQSPAPLIGIRSQSIDGRYCSTVSGPRRLTIDWLCNKDVMETQVVSVVQESTCIFNIQIYAQAACNSRVTCVNVTTADYNGELCPSSPEMLTMVNPQQITFASLDGGVETVALPFNFYMYGAAFTSTKIAVNGVVSFGSDRGAISGPSAVLPITADNQNMLPAILAFWADLYMYAGFGAAVSYSFQTVNNVQAMVIRFNNVDYWNEPVKGINTVTFDVILYSGLTGDVEIRYYDIRPSSFVRRVTAGLVADDLVHSVVLANYVVADEVNMRSLNNSVLKVSYTGLRDEQRPCGALGYDLSSLRNHNLFFNDTAGRNFYNIRICGVVQESLCGGVDGDRSMMCHGTQNVNGVVLMKYTTAVWAPRSSLWQYPATPNGVRLVNSDGVYCSTIGRGRTTIFNFICDASATTPRLSSVTILRTCIYEANITTSAVCSAGNRGEVVPPPPTRSTMRSCETIPGGSYEAIQCPRAENDPLNTPVTLPNPTRILAGVSSSTAMIDIPFAFFIYGTSIDKFYVSAEGQFFFGVGYINDATPGAFPGLGLSASYFPTLAAFWMSLTNGDNSEGVIPYNGFIAWDVIGNAPNRQLIVRFQDVDYYSAREVLFTSSSISFDLVLTEGEPGGIEVRYYRVDSSQFDNVVVGMQGIGDQYTAVNNLEALTPALAGRIRGTTIRYHYTGASVVDFCGNAPGSYDLSPLRNTELNYNTSSYAYYFRPCGTLENVPKCRNMYATSMASVCRTMLTTSTTTLNIATHSPNAISYSFPDTQTLRATYQSGALCSNAPRVSVIDYQCNQGATNAFISYVNENTTCMTYMVVQTNLACSAPPECTAISGNLYNAQLCTADNSMRIPPDQTDPISLFGAVDDATTFVDMPFNFKIYGSEANNLFVSTNGWIGFGGAPASLRVGPLPVGVAAHDALPGVFGFLTDLFNNNLNGTSNITYSVEGNAPNRHVVVRYHELTYYGTRPTQTANPEKRVSFDFRLYEGTGIVDIVYYKVEEFSTAAITIGVQSNDRQSYTAIQNNLRLSESPYVLQGKYIRLLYTGQDYTQNATCGALGYDFRFLMNQELTWTNTTSNSTVFINLCGVVTNPICATNTATERSMACAVIGTPTTTTYRNMMVYSPPAVTWSYLDDGVQFYSQTGSYCSAISGPSVTFTSFICDTTALNPILETVLLTQNGCFNRIVIKTLLACGGGDRANNPPESDRPRTSTLNACYTEPGSNYSATICPTRSTDAWYYPVPMTNPVEIMRGEDNALVAVPIGFDFHFYGVVYNVFNVSTNGYLQFGEGATNTGASTALSSLSALTNNWPVIAAFWSDLVNSNSDVETGFTGKISYSVEGQAPNRQFILRFDMVDYYLNRFWPGIHGVSFDVVLSEGESSDIVVRYYRVDPNPTVYAVVGIRADAPGSTSYTAYLNRGQITALMANELQGTSITYRYTGIPASAACSAYGYSLLSIRGTELSWTNTTSGRTFIHNVCGRVQSPMCTSVPATSQTSLCELDGSYRALYSVTQFNPSAVAWTLLPEGGISLYQATGTYCSSVSGPRHSTINYVCSPSAVVPVLDWVSEIRCRYTAQVSTNAVCSQGGPTVSPQPTAQPTAQPTGQPTAQPTAQPTGQPTAQPTAQPTTQPGVPSSSTGAAGGGGSSSSSSLSGGAIAGIVIGVVVGVLVLLALIFFMCCTNRGGAKAQRLEDEKSHVGDVESRVQDGEANYTQDEEVEMSNV